MAAKKRTQPKPATVKPKKKPVEFNQGDFLVNVEDPSHIVIVTQDAIKESEAFHGTTIRTNKRTLGEHAMFWLKSRFIPTDITITNK